MREFLREVWEVQKTEWRKNIALMKTRVFWIVNVVWFAAGVYFVRLLPEGAFKDSGLNRLLNDLVFLVIFLPIYFTAVLSLSGYINQAIDSFNKWKNGR